MMKLIALFHNFATVPKNYTEIVKPVFINCCVMSNRMKSYYPEDIVYWDEAMNSLVACYHFRKTYFPCFLPRRWRQQVLLTC